jgi:hypothetical protein
LTGAPGQQEAAPGRHRIWRREIQPGLATVKLAEIMAATGLSKSFASRVRGGRSTPDISTWAAMGALVGVPRDR